MNTNLTKLLMPLAALAFGSVACDPFPAKPGGDPAVVRVVTYGGASGDSNTVETVTGGNTVSTDFAQLDDFIAVHFNKPMDGSTIQKYPNYNSDGTPFVPPVGADACTPADGLVLTTFPAGTTACYNPTSPTDGGQLVITPGDLLVYGTTYTIGGTVRDYEGKALTLAITLTVDKRPISFGVDGYTTKVTWFNSPTATTYDVLRSDTAAGTYTPIATGLLASTVCTAGLCEVLDRYKDPETKYFYQVKEGAVLRPDALEPATTRSALIPTLGVATTTTPPPQVLAGIIRVAWGSISGATGYSLETSPDGTTWTAVPTMTTRTYYDGTPSPGTAVPAAAGTLTTGATYYFRVTPVFGGAPVGYVPVKGVVGSKVAP